MNKKEEIKYPIIVYVEGALMENGEVIHYGQTLGYICKKQRELIEAEATRLTKGNEIVVALGDETA